VDRRFQSIYAQSVRIAEKVQVEPCKPRLAQRQQHRSNLPSINIIDHYKLNIAIPFIDHVISHLDHRFSALAITATSLLGLVPAIICSSEVDISPIVKMYNSDLPSPELIDAEIIRWKSR
jgi:hypothetical protein